MSIILNFRGVKIHLDFTLLMCSQVITHSFVLPFNVILGDPYQKPNLCCYGSSTMMEGPEFIIDEGYRFKILVVHTLTF